MPASDASWGFRFPGSASSYGWSSDLLIYFGYSRKHSTVGINEAKDALQPPA